LPLPLLSPSLAVTVAVTANLLSLALAVNLLAITLPYCCILAIALSLATLVAELDEVSVAGVVCPPYEDQGDALGAALF